jgi:hypothetical protein
VIVLKLEWPGSSLSRFVALCPQVVRTSHSAAIALQPVLNGSAMLAVEGTDVALIHGIRHVNLALID